MMIDTELVTDLFDVLSNESEFHANYWNPLDQASTKHFKKGNYQRGKYMEAMQERIRQFLKNGDRTCSYHGFKVPRHDRLGIAAKFADYLEDCLESEVN